jgi:hypothetical protein
MEQQQEEVVEASARRYNTRHAKRNNYTQLGDPFSSK